MVCQRRERVLIIKDTSRHMLSVPGVGESSSCWDQSDSHTRLAFYCCLSFWATTIQSNLKRYAQVPPSPYRRKCHCACGRTRTPTATSSASACQKLRVSNGKCGARLLTAFVVCSYHQRRIWEYHCWSLLVIVITHRAAAAPYSQRHPPVYRDAAQLQ